mmetsp:Transcript_9236/g.13489  ORF Transcript_9236/g.13489 Transcript_9236/m.13489 type:complete len:216 (+) Transcript_9236:1354-2001(+)
MTGIDVSNLTIGHIHRYPILPNQGLSPHVTTPTRIEQFGIVRIGPSTDESSRYSDGTTQADKESRHFITFAPSRCQYLTGSLNFESHTLQRIINVGMNPFGNLKDGSIQIIFRSDNVSRQLLQLGASVGVLAHLVHVNFGSAGMNGMWCLRKGNFITNLNKVIVRLNDGGNIKFRLIARILPTNVQIFFIIFIVSDLRCQSLQLVRRGWFGGFRG